MPLKINKNDYNILETIAEYRLLTPGQLSMLLGKNKLKGILEEGRLAVGSCVYSSRPTLVELMGYCGLVFCRIDNEHS